MNAWRECLKEQNKYHSSKTLMIVGLYLFHTGYHCNQAHSCICAGCHSGHTFHHSYKGCPNTGVPLIEGFKRQKKKLQTESFMGCQKISLFKLTSDLYSFFNDRITRIQRSLSRFLPFRCWFHFSRCRL